MKSRLFSLAGLSLLAFVLAAPAQPPTANPPAPGTETLPWYARVPYPDTNNQPPIVDIGVPNARFEHVGRVTQVERDRVVLVDRIGKERAIPVDRNTWVKHGPSSGSWDEIEVGTNVKVVGKRGKPADRVEIVADIEE